MKDSVFDIANMDCPTEEGIIRQRLKPIAGIDRLDFDLMGRKLTVAHRLDDEKTLLTALQSVGMEARLRSEGNAPGGATGRAGDAGCACCAPALTPGRETQNEPPPAARVPWARMALAGATAAAAEIAAWTSGEERSWPVAALALLSVAAGGRDTFRKGFIALRTLTLNINFLMMLAVAGAVAIGQWPEAAMVTFLFAVAELIEGFSLDRARNAIRGLMELTPEKATVQDGDGGPWREVEAAAVQVGQRVRVKPGERIPLDGKVTTGQSSVNQAPITGESIPVEKRPGDPVFAGSVNERGSFEFQVTANQGNTTLARIVRSVQQAQGQRAPTQRFVDRFALYYTPAVVVAAVLVAAVPPLVTGAAFVPWLYKALVMLVIACPCALVISTPVTVVSGLAAAARLGILVKGGVYLELGRKLKAVALDKTGTLTLGKPALTDLVPLAGGLTRDDALRLAASLDAYSEHPVASAIVAAWTNAGNPERELLPVTDFESITGRGVRGVVNGQLYFVGNHRLTEENKVCGPAVKAELSRFEAEGKTTVVLTTGQAALALLGVADTLRETSIEALRELHALGVKTVMLTGDNQATAQAIAAKVGIYDARGGLLPDDKLAAINELLVRHGTVGMVGDGINDAPALARASIGFAMGAAGTDTALETADVALMQDDLRRLPVFIRLSRQTARVLVQNITLAIGIKLVFFALALTGHATLWMAVIADLGASLLVIFNGLRVLRFGHHELAVTPPPRSKNV